MKRIEAARELLGRYKSITLEQLKFMYKIHPNWKGSLIMNSLTDFGTIYCIICKSASHVCSNCIYSFIDEKLACQCMDIIYREMENATSAEELFDTVQKRISYLTHIIEWYETMDCKR